MDYKLFDDLKTSGLYIGEKELKSKVSNLKLLLAIEKDKKLSKNLWISIIGGTGTGKSTIFNSLCNKRISLTGVERPKTKGPIAACPRNEKIEITFMKVQDMRNSEETTEGQPGLMTLLAHELPYSWVIVDTPDIDSLQREHHEIAEKIYLMADFVIFTMSQEKYADEKLNRFLRRICEDRRASEIVINKITPEMEKEDILKLLASYGVKQQNISFLSFTSPTPWHLRNVEGWKVLEDKLKKTLTSEENLKEERLKRLKKEIELSLEDLINALKKEKELLENLSKAVKETANKIITNSFESHILEIADHSRSHLHPEIQRVYSKYDIFAKPRRFLWNALMKVLAIFGFETPKESESSKEEKLKQIESKIDLSIVFNALNALTKEVFQMVPLSEKNLLAKEIRKPEILLTKEEVSKMAFEHLKKLLQWLEEEMARMLKSLPPSKEIAIYSSFLLWGVFILGIEKLTLGLAPWELVLDSLLAPVVTKTTVGWFAKREIQRIVEELSNKYKSSLESIILTQRDRFLECINSFKVSDETIATIEKLKREFL